MRLVIDCFKLIKGTGKSIGIYNIAQGIVKHLGEINCAKDTKKVEILVLGNKENRDDFDVPGVRFIEIRKLDPHDKAHLLLWELYSVSKTCKRLNADRVFFPRGYTTLLHPVYDIVLIHDLIPFYYKEHFPGVFNVLENAYIMWRLRQSARSAKKVITISKASKEDIIRYCGVDDKRITVIYNACEEIKIKIEKPKTKYISALTSDLPHKNAKGVIESYVKYCKIAENPINLVVIGIHDTSEYDIPETVRNKITCHKFIKNNEDMYKIIGGSEVFLFLSLVEGFGLPPIEAMQLGIPVICSNTSSLPEVVGHAAVIVNPRDYSRIGEELDELLKSKERVKSQIERGFDNAQKYTWKIAGERYWSSLIEGS